eukprot:TRINITY_DN9790_c0_g1_i2.p1 TRINITY_DN9790_c0_g1~~TRINITY_DN9790_c0_g1_i2.p1  ORF type:complete len:425 (-),score=90.91 TRINITY_DN9790_c0_g1_i2:62-1336(-)
MDQYQCLQKIICEWMGQTEDAVVDAVSNQFGSQTGQIAQSSINQIQTNPNQFVQQLQSPNGPIIQAVTAQFDNNNNQPLSQNGQFLQNIGNQFVQQAFQQRPTQSQFQTQFGAQQQFQQFPQQQFPQQQFQQFPQQQIPQQQFQQFPQQQFQQFPQQQFQQFPQQQFQQFPQQQFQQFSQQQQFQQFPQQQFQQFPQQSQNGGILENIAENVAGNLASGILGNLVSNFVSGKKRSDVAERRSDESVQKIEPRTKTKKVDKNEEMLEEFKNLINDENEPRVSRQKRQSTAHGQAIRLMQNFGLDNMGLYPFVRAAIIGHANRASPTNCRQLFRQCPDSTDQLLNYLNNHNGGLFQNAIPSATNEVSSLFPGLPSLPQVAASTIETFAGSNTGSSSNGGSAASSLIQAESGLMNTLVDGLAGMLAG